jgi:NAD(P)-dependent dehydrogenase (short-subunit alcohol dehydrogenase family)
MNQGLKNKIVIITGGSGGLGQEIAICCLKEGMKVILVDKKFPSFINRLEKVNILFFKCDVTSAKEVKNTVDEIIRRFKKIDFLINNAGIGGPLSFITDYSEKEWDKIMNTNLKSVFLFCKECVKHMIKNKTGHIINIASILGKTGFPYFSIYSASKGGMIAFSKSLQEELKQFNIKVDVICPGSMNTPFIDTVRAKGKFKKHLKVKKRINRNRMLDPKDVANVILDIMKYPTKVFFGEFIIRSKDFNP